MDKQLLFERTGRLVFQIQKFETLLSICLAHAYTEQVTQGVFNDIIHPLRLQTKLNLLQKLTSKKGLNFDFKRAEKYKMIRNTIIHGQGLNRDQKLLRKGSKEFPIDDLFAEFESIREPLENDLIEVMKSLGIKGFEHQDTNEADSYDFPVWDKGE